MESSETIEFHRWILSKGEIQIENMMAMDAMTETMTEIMTEIMTENLTEIMTEITSEILNEVMTGIMRETLSRPME